METKSANDYTFDDIVFENRNKDYGAYVIRRAYDENLNKAFFLTIMSGFFLAIALVTLSTLQGNQPIILNPPPVLPTIFTKDLVIKPNELQKKATSKVKAIPEKVIPRVTTAIVPETEVIKPTEPISNQPDVSADNGTGTNPDGPANGDGPGAMAAALPVEKDKIHTYVGIMPMFPDGIDGMRRFLQRNLKYPRRAESMGTEGIVYVSFVVDATGNVISPEIVKGISRECDEEAKRVILKMPTWKPGMQNKMPVMVRMVLPIKFQLQG